MKFVAKMNISPIRWVIEASTASEAAIKAIEAIRSDMPDVTGTWCLRLEPMKEEA